MANHIVDQRRNLLSLQAMAHYTGVRAFPSQYWSDYNEMDTSGIPGAYKDVGSLAHGSESIKLRGHGHSGQGRSNMCFVNTSAMNHDVVNADLRPATYGPVRSSYPRVVIAGSAQTNGNHTPQVAQFAQPFRHHTYSQHNSLSAYTWTPTAVAGTCIPPVTSPRLGPPLYDHNDLPAAPTYTDSANVNNGGAVAHSPPGIFTHWPARSRPMTYSLRAAEQMDRESVDSNLPMLIDKHPAIPPAAGPFTARKPLEHALKKHSAEANVYIRGLSPNTTDEMLHSWGERFGEIISSKSIIDSTGSCKGFGFVKYSNYDDAEKCIRAFHFLGYGVSFARVSFHSELRTLSDEHNTNLYVSELPTTMNEKELAELFAPYVVVSARILRDKDGRGRGVGFARFKNRETCEFVIKTFNNRTIEGSRIGVRFADTREQKALKQEAHRSRQYRIAESAYAAEAWRHNQLQCAGAAEPELEAGADHELEAGADHGLDQQSPDASSVASIQ